MFAMIITVSQVREDDSSHPLLRLRPRVRLFADLRDNVFFITGRARKSAGTETNSVSCMFLRLFGDSYGPKGSSSWARNAYSWHSFSECAGPLRSRPLADARGH